MFFHSHLDPAVLPLDLSLLQTNSRESILHSFKTGRSCYVLNISPHALIHVLSFLLQDSPEDREHVVLSGQGASGELFVQNLEGPSSELECFRLGQMRGGVTPIGD